LAIKLARSPGSRLALGLGLAAFASILGIFLSGSGHGWNTPLFVSVILWVVAPATFYLVSESPSPRLFLYTLAVIALIADFILIKGTIVEAEVLPHYVQINGAIGLIIIAAWLFLWLLWQILVARALIAAHADQSRA
jgi:hypothetical protein